MQTGAAERGGLQGDGEESGRLRAALLDLRGLLVLGESLEAYAVQRRLFALGHRRLIVGATTGRLIVLRRGVIGGFEPKDIRWQDLKDAKMSVGVFGADLILTAARGGDMAVASQGTETFMVTGLRKAQAAGVYRICQAQEQAWREKRRIREIEEIRAKSGGIAIGASVGTAEGGLAGARDGNPAERLQRAREMLQKGLITDSEYESIKAKIVSGL
jgi:hypothetical protein